MKTNMNNRNLFQKHSNLKLVSIFLLILPLYISAQNQNSVSGEITGENNHELIAFANVALFDSTGARLIGGAASNAEGRFLIENVNAGKYKIIISALGFESWSMPVEINGKSISLGTIGLTEKQLELNDVVVKAERIKARSEPDKNTYFVSLKMQEASNSGTDILRLLPGVSVDLQQNISLEGSSNILILVDGKERDPGFLRQLQAGKIDKVEIISNPGAKYDANITGVINIMLKKEKNTGIDGHVYAEIPATQSAVLLNPAYSLNFGFGKLNLFTSYNGDLRRFDITETYNREIDNHPGISRINSTQLVTQKTWSHRFHYGFDWMLNANNQVSFYGYYNPFSQELDGSAKIETNGTEPGDWQAFKNDEDQNTGTFYSLWYKHNFREKHGHELTMDLNLYNLKASNSTLFTNENGEFLHENLMKPDNRSANFRLDYTLPIAKGFQLNSGIQTRLRTMRDRNNLDFSYDENNYALFGNAGFNIKKLEANIGIRAENAERKLPDGQISDYYMLPTIAVKYDFNKTQNLKFNYRRAAIFPGFYQLNESASADDPFTVSSGNAILRPELNDNFSLEYAIRLKNHFVSARLFYDITPNAIRNLIWMNENRILEIQKNNLGEIRQTGILVSGAFAFGKAGFNPYLKIADVYSIPNQLSIENYIAKKHTTLFEPGLSAYFTFKNDITATFTFQYTSPVNEIQGTSFSDPLYFISVEKTFAKKLKAGLVSGVPFTKDFTYQGNKTSGHGFKNHTEGVVNLPAFPLWIKLSYQFSSGKKEIKSERPKSVTEPEKRKGF
ncbi:MAG TPA: hypothetical protein DER09_11400 [Prolixibacteraceae bacterium]|nr:hypothetical protein [Prolixibacteraceae bacterium]